MIYRNRLLSATDQDAKGSTKTVEIWKARKENNLAFSCANMETYRGPDCIYVCLQKTVGNTK